MQKIYLSSNEFKTKVAEKNSAKKSYRVLTLGNFDGVHLAHQRLIQLALKEAKKNHGKCYLYTFEPHPVKVLSQAAAPLMIHSLAQKTERIFQQGVDGIILEKFDSALAKMSAQEWFQKIVLQRLKASSLITGYDFTFGYQRSGSTETLQQLCQEKQMHFQALPAQLLKKTLISSTQIRHFLQKGDILHANALLNYPFFIDATVIKGLGRGQKIGIPTANLNTENELIPPRGVYACRLLYQKQYFDAVTNIGINPSFGGQTLSIESHLLNFSKNIYEKKLRLFFYKKLREENYFPSVKDLVQQIKKDIQATKIFLRKIPKLKI